MGEATRTMPRARTAAYPVGLQVGIGALLALTATVVGAVLPASAPWWRAAPLAVGVLVFAALGVRIPALATTAVLGYLLLIGFLINRYGELSWHGWLDAGRLLLIGAAVGVGRLIHAHMEV